MSSSSVVEIGVFMMRAIGFAATGRWPPVAVVSEAETRLIDEPREPAPSRAQQKARGRPVDSGDSSLTRALCPVAPVAQPLTRSRAILATANRFPVAAPDAASLQRSGVAILDESIRQIIATAVGAEVRPLVARLEAQDAELSEMRSSISTLQATVDALGERGLERVYLTPRQAAERVGVSLRTIRRWTDSGRVPTVRLPGGRLRIAATDVGRLLIGEPDPKAAE